MEDCEFCRIAGGDAEAHRLHEDDRTVAILDDNPAVTGHALVFPRTHREDLTTAPDADWAAVFRTVHALAGAMGRALDPDGYSVFHTSGDLAGTVTHAHVHLLPRSADDGVSVSLARGRLEARDGDRLAARLREELA